MQRQKLPLSQFTAPNCVPNSTEDINEYWTDARRPLSCLLFLAPLIATYEAGVLMLADREPDQIRNGADYWMRSVLSVAGLGQVLLLPVLVVGILLTWHILRHHP